MSTCWRWCWALRCFLRLGYFPRPADVPAAVVEHIRRGFELAEGTAAFCGAETGKWQRRLVRERLGVVHDPERARAVAAEAIRSAAEAKNNPPDLINVALEMLVKESLELPAFSTLDEIASRIRREVNTAMFERIAVRIGLPDRVGLESLLEVVGSSAKTPFSRLKQAAGKASWSGFRDQVEHLRWVDSLGDSAVWLEGIAASKIADFAGEAMVADAGVMRNVAPSKRLALLACVVHVARTRARDDLAEMFCKRMAQVTKLAKAELAEVREHQAEMSERLITNYRSVLGCLDPRNAAQPTRRRRCAWRGGRSRTPAGLRRSSPISRRSRRITPTTTCRWSPSIAAATARPCSRSPAPLTWRRRARIAASWTPCSTRWRTRTWSATSSQVISMGSSLTCRSHRSSGSGSSSTAPGPVS